MEKRIHIVSFDVPYPADYGGVIDVLARVEKLKAEGVYIQLHCFTYGRGEPKELYNFADEVYFYPRKRSLFAVFSKKPFIVKTRQSKQLINRLNKNNDPIWLEGLHCCGVLERLNVTNRKLFVRMHNIESEYYNQLATFHRGWRKWFFKLEGSKIHRYESIVKRADHVFCIKPQDAHYYSDLGAVTSVLPASIPVFETAKSTEVAHFALFHGNLSVSENHEAALKIIQNTPNFKLIIAGKNPKRELMDAAKYTGVELISNPSQLKMQQLIADAHVHLLYTEQDSGVKLKILMAIQSTGYLVGNKAILPDSRFQDVITCLENVQDIIGFTERLMQQPPNSDVQARRVLFQSILEEERKAYRKIWDL